MANLTWMRHPFLNTGYASYELLEGDKPTGIWVQWCGHGTALRPYYVKINGQPASEPMRGVKVARALAEQMYAARLTKGAT